MQKKKKAIFLLGPTASGKSALALQLVARYPLEIISVDSGMVYQGMNIGTAKPGKEILDAVPHHLINLHPVDRPYSAGLFQEAALQAMRDIRERGKIPLLVGGTMLYFRALERGLAPMPKASNEIRERLNQQASKLGWPVLHQQLQRIDPQAAAAIQPNDSQRIQRALEVYELTAKPISQLQKITQSRLTEDDQILRLILYPTDRQKLQHNIACRFQAMLEEGLIKEVETLLNQVEGSLPVSLRAVGYRQAVEYLQNKIDFKEMETKAIIATRQLAKRQLTWLRGDPSGHWFDMPTTPVPSGGLLKIVENLLNK